MAADSPTRKFQKNKDFEFKSNKPSQVLNKNPNQKPFKPEIQNKERYESVEPMDATTTRSRLTLNRRSINNHETVSNDPEQEIPEDSQSDDEYDDDDLDLNFHLGFTNQNQT